MRRPLRIALIIVGVIVFLAISGLLARFLSVENAEREDDLALIEAEAAGDAGRVIAGISGCAGNRSCVAQAHANASDPRIVRGGSIKIVQLQSPTAYSLSGSTGKTRLAWTTIGKLPVVQCLLVKRTGNFLTGISVHVLALSPPISGEGECTPHPRNEEEEVE